MQTNIFLYSEQYLIAYANNIRDFHQAHAASFRNDLKKGEMKALWREVRETLIERELEEGSLPDGICHDEKGRPYLKGQADTELSLSDTGGGYGFLLGQTRGGLDIQRAEKKPDLRRLAQRFFHPEEAAWILKQSEAGEAQLLSSFYLIWTAKEAYVKQTGSGIDAGFSAFSVLPKEDGRKPFESSYRCWMQNGSLFFCFHSLGCYFVQGKLLSLQTCYLSACFQKETDVLIHVDDRTVCQIQGKDMEK